MELFNKYKNKDFTYITNYINSCILDPDMALTPDEIKDQLLGDNQSTFEEIVNSILNHETGISKESPNADLLYEREGKMLPLRQIPIHIRPSYAEQAWLYYLLNDSKADLFLSPETKEKLLNALSQKLDSPLSSEYVDIREFATINTLDISSEMITNFHNIVKAITEHRYLSVTNKSFAGEVYTNQKVIPYKLEYAAQFDSFSLSCYPLEAKRPIKMNLRNLTNVITGEKIKNYDDFIINFEKLLSETREKEPVVIEIMNQDDAYDRCSYLFSSYEKVCYQNDTNHLVMNIYYYRFQQDDIIKNILFLGPYVKVVSPYKIVNSVINTMKQSYYNYKAGE